MQILIRIIKKLLYSGTWHCHPNDIRRVRSLNFITLSSQLLVILYTSVYFYSGAWKAGTINCFVVGIGILVYYLTRIGKNRIASIILPISFILEILSLTSLYIPSRIGIQFYLIGVSTVSFLIISEKDKYILYAISTFAFLLFPIIEFKYIQPIYPHPFSFEVKEMFFRTSFILSCSYVTIVTVLFYRNVKFANRIMQKDLQVAQKIQSSILKYNEKEFNRLNIHSIYNPMFEVGGDFFSFHKLKDDKYRILIADATGHGVQAAMITMAIKAIFDYYKDEEISTSALMEKLNRDYTKHHSNISSLMTAILMDIDFAKKELEYVSAGHPGFIIQKGKEQNIYEKTGKIIGVKKDLKYSQRKVKIEKGDRLFLFTDGIFEQFNSEGIEYGEARLYKHFESLSTKHIKNCLREVHGSLLSFLAGKDKQDDITILGLEIL